MKRLLLIFLGGLTLSYVAHAVSLDCNNARSKLEKLICSDAVLSMLDDEMNTVYTSALGVAKEAESIRGTQKQWLNERNSCADTFCIRNAYETRLSFLRAARSTSVISSTNANNAEPGSAETSVTEPISCDKNTHGNSKVRVQDIAGLYRQSVSGQPAYIGRPEEKLSGYNYLAVSPLEGNRIRVRLSTKEINGHDCFFDRDALLCGRTIRLIPTSEDLKSLIDLNLPTPYLNITQNEISFASIGRPHLYEWQRLYCGNMGSLNHSFKRSTRELKFDGSIFSK